MPAKIQLIFPDTSFFNVGDENIELGSLFNFLAFAFKNDLGSVRGPGGFQILSGRFATCVCNINQFIDFAFWI